MLLSWNRCLFGIISTVVRSDVGGLPDNRSCRRCICGQVPTRGMVYIQFISEKIDIYNWDLDHLALTKDYISFRLHKNMILCFSYQRRRMVVTFVMHHPIVWGIKPWRGEWCITISLLHYEITTSVPRRWLNYWYHRYTTSLKTGWTHAVLIGRTQTTKCRVFYKKFYQNGKNYAV